MGTQFALVYDLAVAAILIGMLFSGLKRGFASAVVSLAAVVIGFICAMTLSKPISDSIYTSYVEQPVKQTVNIAIDEVMGSVVMDGIENVDFSTVRVNGVAVEDIEPNYSGTNKALFDLSSVDLSDTGLADVDLTKFGIATDADLSDMNGKTAEFTMTDINRYGLGQMITAQVIAINMQNSEIYRAFITFTDSVGEAVPLFFGDMSAQVSVGSIEPIRSVVLIMQSAHVNIRDAVIDGIVKPCFNVTVQTIVFSVIFFAVVIILNLVAKLLKFVNKIPVIGGFNSFCGGLVGIVQGLITVCVVCLLVRVIVVMSGGNIIFFNNAVIDSTMIFSFFYDFEFLNFIS